MRVQQQTGCGILKPARRTFLRARLVSSVALFSISPGLLAAEANKESKDEQAALKAAATVLRADEIKTLQFIASGDSFTVGQNFTPNEPWPRVEVTSFKALLIMKASVCAWSCPGKWERRCRMAAVSRSPANCVRFKW
jgi:hypothetical protein